MSAFVFEYSLHPYCAKTMHETKVEALPNSLCSNINAVHSSLFVCLRYPVHLSFTMTRAFDIIID